MPALMLSTGDADMMIESAHAVDPLLAEMPATTENTGQAPPDGV